MNINIFEEVSGKLNVTNRQILKARVASVGDAGTNSYIDTLLYFYMFT